MSQELLKNKKIIEGLEQKIHELSSLRKPNEISGVSPNVNAESDKIKLLKSSLELEKLRAKHAREKLKHERKNFEHERMKFKYEESCRSILQHELHRLKLDFIQNYNHLTMLDASFSTVAGSIHGLPKVGFLAELFSVIYVPSKVCYFISLITMSHIGLQLQMNKNNV
jgi:hypothetical protein